MNIHFETCGTGKIPVIWAHGWGQTGAAFKPLAGSLHALGPHILLDLPGFGETPAPQEGDWGSEEYAEACAIFIRTHFKGRKIIWIGHSFGCRVGIQLAAHYPELLERLVLIAAAGLPRKRSLIFKAQVALFKILKTLPLIDKDRLRKRFGSADYLNAGPLRGTFLKIIREDLSPQAAQIKCPTQIIYGAEDTQTPPEMGWRYHALIKGSIFTELNGFDHHTLLSTGRHQIASLIKTFIERPAP